MLTLGDLPMKLLIVDDEYLTRNGLLTSIKWTELGISEVFLASDGVTGLANALKNKPEIILCDVRMPRMNGIQMVENLQKTLPDSIIIFMSGYSDKEYLKAAIKLKAINYVEKPLNLNEIKEAVLDSIANYKQKQHTLQGENWHQYELTSKLALQLTLPFEKSESSISELCHTLALHDMEHAYYSTFLIKLSDKTLLDSEMLRFFLVKLNEFLKPYNYYSLMTEKHHHHLIFFIVSPVAILMKNLNNIAAFFRIETTKYGNAFICQGKMIRGIKNIYQSYEIAVILMQSSFFFDTNQLLSAEDIQNNTFSNREKFLQIHNFTDNYKEQLQAKNRLKCLLILDSLYDIFYENTNFFADQARDLYYKLFTILQEMYQKMQILKTDFLSNENETIIRYLEQFHSFKTLHNDLKSKTIQYFSALNNQVEENSTVYMIKEYIQTHYKNESLSVKDISEHVYLSVSYVCTIFKNETGQTLNQYITEYRMEKAKSLLQDYRNKIADISAKVGYSDGNYFGKIFKKSTALSPSEYREKMTK